MAVVDVTPRTAGKGSNSVSGGLGDDPSPSGASSAASMTDIPRSLARMGSQPTSSSGSSLLRSNSVKKPESPVTQDAKNAKLASGAPPGHSRPPLSGCSATSFSAVCAGQAPSSRFATPVRLFLHVTVRRP